MRNRLRGSILSSRNTVLPRQQDRSAVSQWQPTQKRRSLSAVQSTRGQRSTQLAPPGQQPVRIVIRNTSRLEDRGSHEEEYDPHLYQFRWKRVV